MSVFEPLMSALPVAASTYGLFLIVMAALAITPGPANLFAIATGVAEGPRAALLGVVGMNVATLVWFIGAALGLSALVAAFPAQFHWLSIAGGLYVAWLGGKAVATAFSKEKSAAAIPPGPPGHAFWRGFTVQITNPKALLFFTAILPPFLDPARPAASQLAAFAAGALVLDSISMSAYALGGAALSARMQQQRFRAGFNLFVGALLLSAAALILLRH
jgi:threonine/homoserine/homoserine lactone efflux protein